MGNFLLGALAGGFVAAVPLGLLAAYWYWAARDTRWLRSEIVAQDAKILDLETRLAVRDREARAAKVRFSEPRIAKGSIA